MFAVPDNVHWKWFDSDLVILNLNRGEYYGLSEVGAQAFERLVNGQAPEAVVQALTDLYDADAAKIASDLEGLIVTLIEKGLLVRSPTNAGSLPQGDVP